MPGQKDFDRPLNERGHHDAPMMAQRLLEKKILIDVFLSSTANRAITTAVYFAETYQRKKKEIQGFQKLYHASSGIFYEVICQTDDTIVTAAVFSHNPGITDFVNSLTTTQIDNMPTCGVFAVKAETNHWKDFRSAKKTFWFFDYPKL